MASKKGKAKVTQKQSDRALEELYARGSSYPGAHTKAPWPGHRDLAVNDKTFAYLSPPGEPFTLSCKLPQSAGDALALPFTEPTAYGLGKSGWVTASLPEGVEVPVELFEGWIEESYRAQAPKRLARQLEAGVPAQKPPAPPKKKRAKKVSPVARSRRG